jgi:hypothetical protein
MKYAVDMGPREELRPFFKIREIAAYFHNLRKGL